MIWGPLIAAMLCACGEAKPAPDARCTLRVSARGVYVDGDPVTSAQAIVACKRTPGGAVVIVADDAPPQAWPALHRELERQHIKIYMRGLVDDHPPCLNPFGPGCD